MTPTLPTFSDAYWNGPEAIAWSLAVAVVVLGMAGFAIRTRKK